MKLVSFNFKVSFNQNKLYDNNVALIKKILNFFLCYFNYSVSNILTTQKFNFENSTILDFGSDSL